MPQIPQSYDFPANNHSQSALTNNPVSEKQKVLRDAPSNKKDEGSKKKIGNHLGWYRYKTYLIV